MPAAGLAVAGAERLVETDLVFLPEIDGLATRCFGLAEAVDALLDVPDAPVLVTDRRGRALGLVGRVPGFLAPGKRLASAEGLLLGRDPGLADGRVPGLPLGFDPLFKPDANGVLFNSAASPPARLCLIDRGAGPNSFNVNSPSLFWSS